MADNKTQSSMHPAHYQHYAIEPIEICAGMDFCLGNIVKYIMRSPFSGHGVQDIEKALQYLSHMQNVSIECRRESWPLRLALLLEDIDQDLDKDLASDIINCLKCVLEGQGKPTHSSWDIALYNSLHSLRRKLYKTG